MNLLRDRVNFCVTYSWGSFILSLFSTIGLEQNQAGQVITNGYLIVQSWGGGGGGLSPEKIINKLKFGTVTQNDQNKAPMFLA